MITLTIENTRSCKLTKNEEVRKGDNNISAFSIVFPSNFGAGHPRAECAVEMRCYLPNGEFLSYELDTSQPTATQSITYDLTEQEQQVSIMFIITHGVEVIGKTNSETLYVYDAPEAGGEPLTPREDFDRVINEQRQTISRQAARIDEQSETIGSQSERITELSNELEEIRKLLPVYIPARLQSKKILPNIQTKYYPPDEGYDGFSSVTAAGVTVEGLGLNENYYKFGEPFIDKVGTYHPFPENSYGGIYFTELNEDDFPVGIKVVNYDFNYNDFIIPVLNMNTFINNVKTFILLDCKKVKLAGNYFLNALLLTTCRLDGVTSIGNYTFRYCSSLTDLTLPNSLTSIGNYTFQGCTSLTRLTLAQGFNCNGLNVSDSTRYSIETLVAMLEALADRTGQTAYTLTIGATNLNKLTTEQKAIAIGKNWNLA